MILSTRSWKLIYRWQVLKTFSWKHLYYFRYHIYSPSEESIKSATFSYFLFAAIFHLNMRRIYRKARWLWTARGASVINTSNLRQLRFHGYFCHSDDCAGIFKSEYCYWGTSRTVQTGKLAVNRTAFFKKLHD